MYIIGKKYIWVQSNLQLLVVSGLGVHPCGSGASALHFQFASWRARMPMQVLSLPDTLQSRLTHKAVEHAEHRLQ